MAKRIRQSVLLVEHNVNDLISAIKHDLLLFCKWYEGEEHSHSTDHAIGQKPESS